MTIICGLYLTGRQVKVRKGVTLASEVELVTNWPGHREGHHAVWGILVVAADFTAAQLTQKDSDRVLQLVEFDVNHKGTAFVLGPFFSEHQAESILNLVVARRIGG